MANFIVTDNLGADFDVGTKEPNKLNVVPASTTVSGVTRFATDAEIDAGVSGKFAVNPAGIERRLTDYFRRDANNTVQGLTILSRASGLQMRVGFSTGAPRNTYMTFYHGETVQGGVILQTADRFSLYQTSGGKIDMLSSGNVLVNGSVVWTDASHKSASETVEGAVTLATDAEAVTGTDTTKAITPAALKAAFASRGL